MSRYYSYLNTAKSIVADYDGAIPLAAWLKQFFAARKQMGGRDRREVASIVYQYFRLGKACESKTFEERISIALFLCNNQPNALLQLLSPLLNEQISLPLTDKITLLDGFNTLKIFENRNFICVGIDKEAFALSHLVQPDLFLRVRPNHKKPVIEKLKKNEIVFAELDNNCLAISNKTAIDVLLEIDKEVVIQDYSSQQIARFLQLINQDKKSVTIWDCCAASGGKSILAKDIFNKIELTVSDVRASIIQNLKNRFAKAGIINYRSLVVDLSTTVPQLKNAFFDVVICDAPCSGSGTWGRTPENLVFFNKETIKDYVALQKTIVGTACKHVALGGYFLYITCSVFEQENEEVVAFITKEHSELSLIKKELIIGHEKRADNMFAALFKRI